MQVSFRSQASRLVTNFVRNLILTLFLIYRHDFHRNCIDPWLLQNYTCPLCKCRVLKQYGFVVSSRTSNNNNPNPNPNVNNTSNSNNSNESGPSNA